MTIWYICRCMIQCLIMIILLVYFELRSFLHQLVGFVFPKTLLLPGWFPWPHFLLRIISNFQWFLFVCFSMIPKIPRIFMPKSSLSELFPPLFFVWPTFFVEKHRVVSRPFPFPHPFPCYPLDSTKRRTGVNVWWMHPRWDPGYKEQGHSIHKRAFSLFLFVVSFLFNFWWFVLMIVSFFLRREMRCVDFVNITFLSWRQ